jgi:hypothetical protein
MCITLAMKYMCACHACTNVAGVYTHQGGRTGPSRLAPVDWRGALHSLGVKLVVQGSSHALPSLLATYSAAHLPTGPASQLPRLPAAGFGRKMRTRANTDAGLHYDSTSRLRRYVCIRPWMSQSQSMRGYLETAANG